MERCEDIPVRVINDSLLFPDSDLIENKTAVSTVPELRWVTFTHHSPVFLLLVAVSLCLHLDRLSRMTTRTQELWRISIKIVKRFSRSLLKDPKF